MNDATDFLKAAVSFVCVTLIAVAWVHFSRQKVIIRSARADFAIAARIALIHAVMIPVICLGTGCSIDLLAIPLVIVLILLPVAKLDNVAGDNAIGLAFSAMIILPVYLLKQFALGFPDRGDFILVPAASRLRRSPEICSGTGIAVTPLRPYGYVELNGERVAATTVDGSFIETGKSVDICGRRNRALLVKSLPEKVG